MDDSKQQQSDSESSEREMSSSPSQKKDKKAPSKNKTKIVINISDCQYPVVGKVAKHFGWKKQKTADTMDWDVCWTDNAVQPQTLLRMELHQKINHFPGMYNLARKNLLGRGLMKMRKKFPEDFDFFPLTWMLPVEYHELKSYFDAKAKGKARTFIVKPECMSQGKGIFLTRKLQDINSTSHCVVQRYLHKPYLVQGLKFDLRVYVLIASVDPLTIYLYEQGLGRFATEKYEAPNRQNMEEVCMHLTNYAINKDNPKFVFNQSEKDMSKGHKRSLTSVYELLQKQGVDVQKLKAKIKDCIIKTMISGLPHLTNNYKSCQPESHAANMCFQLLGFDVLLNDQAEPIILQINHTPSFTTDTPLDHYIKFNYIKDALTIMNINERYKNQVIKMQRQACQQRVMTGKKVKLTVQEKQSRKKEAIDKKLKYQKKHLGKFQRIYPTQDQVDPYKQFIQYSEQLFQISVGGRKVKKVQKIQETKLSSKPKPKKPNLTTTPDLFIRRTIAERKYGSKQSINANESQNLDEKELETKQPAFRTKPLSSFDKIMKDQSDYVTPSYKTENELQFYPMSKTPQQLTNNYTLKEKQKNSNKQPFDRQFLREFRSIKKLGGSSKDNISQKRVPREKEKIFSSKISNQKQKIPIALNTLLINGIEQQTNFVIGNLKKYVIGRSGKPQ